MTNTEYTRRIEHAFHVAQWQDANPFRRVAIERLERAGLAALGGLHKPSTPATDTSVIREQPKVDHARDVAEALDTDACDF